MLRIYSTNTSQQLGICHTLLKISIWKGFQRPSDVCTSTKSELKTILGWGWLLFLLWGLVGLPRRVFGTHFILFSESTFFSSRRDVGYIVNTRISPIFFPFTLLYWVTQIKDLKKFEETLSSRSFFSPFDEAFATGSFPSLFLSVLSLIIVGLSSVQDRLRWFSKWSSLLGDRSEPGLSSNQAAVLELDSLCCHQVWGRLELVQVSKEVHVLN